ncbi:4105_t:CDS:2, partial [Dentiscutata erythropus]
MSNEVDKVCELVILQKVNCKARAITTFLNNSHYLKKSRNHEYSSSATSAHNTRNKPSKIIQHNIAATPTSLLLYISTKEALRIRIKCIRKNTILSKPKILEEIEISIILCYTLSAPYWVMDDTFKTVSSLFLATLYYPYTPLNDFAKDNDIQLNSSTIITDFELAARNLQNCYAIMTKPQISYYTMLPNTTIAPQDHIDNNITSLIHVSSSSYTD